MSHKNEELILKNKHHKDKVIKFEPNWYDWEETLDSVKNEFPNSAALYIEIENDDLVLGTGLTLKQMKKLKKYLNDKIKYLEER